MRAGRTAFVLAGGGSLGCELAEYLVERGKKVSVVEILGQIAADAKACQLEQNLAAAQVPATGLSEADRRAIEKTTAEQARGVSQITETTVSVAEQVEHIANALQEQRRGSERIAQAAERMREITRLVKSAAQEQTTGSRQIANAVESVTVQAAQVARSTSEQNLAVQQISGAISSIQQITQETVDVTVEMDTAVKALKTKSDTLQKELEGFRL